MTSFIPGSLIKTNAQLTGVYVIENKHYMTTKKVLIDEGIYVVIDVVNKNKSSSYQYLEILYNSKIALILHNDISKVCSIICE